MAKKNNQVDYDMNDEPELDSDSAEKELKPKNKKYSKKIIFLFIFFILFFSLLIFLAKNWQKTNLKFKNLFSNSAYSENQQRVIDNFGLPQTFTLARDGEQVLENWKYIYLDEIFVFQNGEFIAMQHFNFDVELEEAVHLNLEPKDFYSISSLEELNVLLGSQPSFEAEIDERLDSDQQFFVSYNDLLNASLVDGKIIALQTIALKNSLDSSSDTTKNGDLNSIEKSGKIFIANSGDADNSFSYYLDDPVFRLIKQRPIHLEGEYPTYAYCYSLDQGASFETEPQNPGACADEESMVWIINLYPLDVYDNFNELDLMGMEELIRNNDYVFAITHTNGDLPEGLPQWPTILSDLKDDFSVPVAIEFQSLID